MKQFRNAWRGYCETVDSFNCENPMKTNYLFAFCIFLIFTFVYFRNKRLVGMSMRLTRSTRIDEESAVDEIKRYRSEYAEQGNEEAQK